MARRTKRLFTIGYEQNAVARPCSTKLQAWGG